MTLPRPSHGLREVAKLAAGLFAGWIAFSIGFIALAALITIVFGLPMGEVRSVAAPIAAIAGAVMVAFFLCLLATLGARPPRTQ